MKNQNRNKPAGRLVILLLCVMQAPVVFGALANRDKQGLRSYTIEGVLRLQDSQIDIATAALILSREWGTQRTTHVYRARIDQFAEDIQQTLREKHIAADHRAIGIINEYLFDEQGFAPLSNADNPQDLFLHNVLEKKRGYCLGLSVLYLSVCERLGMPVYGVVVPGHFFVRYDDGQGHRYNIETTSRGATADDRHYIEKFNSPVRDTTLYMKNLTPKQTLGCFFNNLGNSYLQIGDVEKAFQVLQSAVAINPLLSEANMNLGNIYLQKGMPVQAVCQYEKALDILGDDAKILNNLASAYMQLENFPKAEACCRAALKADPEYADVRRNLARVLKAQGKLTEAVSMLRAAVVLSPEDPECAALLGLICKDLKDYPEAEKYLLRALELSPDHAQARLGLGYAYLEQNRAEPAADAFQAALAYNSQQPAAWFGLAQSYRQAGRIDDEIWAWQQAISLDPSMAAAFQNLGNAYMLQQRIEEAVDAYRRGVVQDPANTGLRYNLAAALAKMDLHKQAVTEFLEVIRRDPSDARSYNGAAISYYYLQDYQAAKLYAEKAAQLGFNVQKQLLELK